MLALEAGVAGCGAAKQDQSHYPASYASPAAKQSEQPSAPTSPGLGETSADAESGYGAGGYPSAAPYPTSTAYPGGVPGAPPPTPRYAAPPPPLGTFGGSLPAEDRARALLDDFLVAETALMASGASCFDACRALRSMQRAAARLCELASNGPERQRCEAAEDRYRAARARVRSACGQCQGGPSLEPSAPIQDEG